MQGRPYFHHHYFHGPLDRVQKLRTPTESLPSIRMPIIAHHLIGSREDSHAVIPRLEIIKDIATLSVIFLVGCIVDEPYGHR